MTNSYTYCIIRYVHDPGAGERLNVGVVVYSAEAAFLDLRLETRYARLSKTFHAFDGDAFRDVLKHLESQIREERARIEGIEGLFERPADVGCILRTVWPDMDLSYQFSPVLSGICGNLRQTLESLFQRMVESQWAGEEAPPRRDDREIWAGFQGALSRERVTRVLHPKLVETNLVNIQFDHAYKNHKWHALEAISFDYKQVASIQRRAAEWLGYGTGLMSSDVFGTLYMLLGKPQLSSHRIAYGKAKDLLNSMPVPHQLIEEDEADDFARDLASRLRREGVISAEAGHEEPEG